MTPTLLTRWYAENEPRDTMVYKSVWMKQCSFYLALGRFLKTDPMVISTHTSKSIVCPVVEFKKEDLTLLSRDNFHDVKWTVESKSPVMISGVNLFDENESIWVGYFQGFPEGRVHGAYSKNKCKFSIELGNLSDSLRLLDRIMCPR